MRLIIVDVFPALLFGEGREPSGYEVPDGAAEVLDHLYQLYRLAAIADAVHTASGIQEALEVHDLAVFFESIGTSADFGPAVSPRVVRRLITTIRVPVTQVAVVTGRKHLAEQLRLGRFAVILTEAPDGFLGVPEAMEAIENGKLIP